MPSRRHPDFGDLLVNMRVKFPDHIDPAIGPLLEQALPPRAPVAAFPPEVVVDEVDIVDMDERQQQEYAKGTAKAKAKDENKDEEPGAQCANQ
jgi:DnaJ homolog subfamily A member 2